MAASHFSGPVTITNGPLTVGGVVISATEIGFVDGITAGTVTASKAVVVDSNKDISAFRNVTATNVDAGASGTAGTVDIFPATTAKGKIQIAAANSAGDTTTTITNASQAGARTYTIPDGGASANFVLSTGTSTATTATSTELSILSGATVTATELNLICDQSVYTETLSANGANTSALTKRVHAIDTTAGAQTCTPAAPGTANIGVVNVWTMTVRGGSNDHVMTLTNFRGGSAATSATFDSVGETLTAIGGPDNKWHIIGEDGVTLA